MSPLLKMPAHSNNSSGAGATISLVHGTAAMYGSGGRGFQKGGGPGGGSQRPPLLEIPPNLRMMFEPRMPVEFKLPIESKALPPYTGVAQLTSLFETTPPPPASEIVNPAARKALLKAKLMNAHQEKNELLVSDWDPHCNPKATGNAYVTLFVGRLSYETNEKKLRREFEQFGNIKSLRVVQNAEGQPRGYAFIEFENEAEMTNAYRKAEGKKIDGRRIVCDVERGRTVRNWRPTRFGGGLGGRPETKSKKKIKDESQASAAAASAPSAMGSRGGGGYERERERPRSNSRDRRGGAADRGRGGDGRSDVRPDSRAGDNRGEPRGDVRRERSRSRDRARRENSRDRSDRDRDYRDRDRDRERDRGDRDRDRDQGRYAAPPSGGVYGGSGRSDRDSRDRRDSRGDYGRGRSRDRR